MPISEVVSGSFNAAAIVRDIVLAADPHRQIYRVNSRGAGAELDLIFILFDMYLKNNPHVSFEDTSAYFGQLEAHSKLLLRRNERQARDRWFKPTHQYCPATRSYRRLRSRAIQKDINLT